MTSTEEWYETGLFEQADGHFQDFHFKLQLKSKNVIFGKLLLFY